MVLLRRSQLARTLPTRRLKFRLSSAAKFPGSQGEWDAESGVRSCALAEAAKSGPNPGIGVRAVEGVSPNLHPRALLGSLTQNTVE